MTCVKNILIRSQTGNGVRVIRNLFAKTANTLIAKVFIFQVFIMKIIIQLVFSSIPCNFKFPYLSVLSKCWNLEVRREIFFSHSCIWRRMGQTTSLFVLFCLFHAAIDIFGVELPPP